MNMNWKLENNDNFYKILVSNLEKELHKNSSMGKTNLSVILDIDGTIIDHYFKPIIPVCNFYKYCMNRGLNLIIITARPGYTDNISGTINMLLKMGLPHKTIYFMKLGTNNQPSFKLHARQDVRKNGLNAVMSIGDNPWDIGKDGGLGVILNQKNDSEIFYNIFP